MKVMMLQGHYRATSEALFNRRKAWNCMYNVLTFSVCMWGVPEICGKVPETVCHSMQQDKLIQACLVYGD